MKFFTVLSWIFAVLSSGLVVLRVVGFMCYSELDKLRDNVRGYERGFPVMIPGIVAIICWAWILSQ